MRAECSGWPPGEILVAAASVRPNARARRAAGTQSAGRHQKAQRGTRRAAPHCSVGSIRAGRAPCKFGERDSRGDAHSLARRGEIRLRVEPVARRTTQRVRSVQPADPMNDAYDNVSVLRPRPTAEMATDITVRVAEKVPLFTRHTLASYLNVHVNTIDRLVKRGEIVAYRVVGKLRFYPEDVEQYVRAHRQVD
ncbi:MAG: helix-turn-helix domain-containing protein [Actinobacteria bacterium]|nr:MAG: helix-turn-helix domain-containing protein [Actinomycetota bacterium]